MPEQSVSQLLAERPVGQYSNGEPLYMSGQFLLWQCLNGSRQFRTEAEVRKALESGQPVPGPITNYRGG
jgi:hypothetical protein